MFKVSRNDMLKYRGWTITDTKEKPLTFVVIFSFIV